MKLSAKIWWRIVFVAFPLVLLISWIFSSMLGEAKVVFAAALLLLFFFVWLYGFLWIYLNKSSLGWKKSIFFLVICFMFSVIFSMYVYWHLESKSR